MQKIAQPQLDKIAKALGTQQQKVSVVSAKPSPPAVYTRSDAADLSRLMPTDDGPGATKGESAVEPIPPSIREIFDQLILEANLKLTEHTRALLKAMMDAGVPLSQQNILRANQATRLMQSHELGVFMLKNQIVPTAVKATALLNVRTGGLGGQLVKVMAAIEAIPDPALRAALQRVFEAKPFAEGASKPAVERTQPAVERVQTAVERAQTAVERVQTAQQRPAEPQMPGQPAAKQAAVQTNPLPASLAPKSVPTIPQAVALQQLALANTQVVLRQEAAAQTTTSEATQSLLNPMQSAVQMAAQSAMQPRQTAPSLAAPLLLAAPASPAATPTALPEFIVRTVVAQGSSPAVAQGSSPATAQPSMELPQNMLFNFNEHKPDDIGGFLAHISRALGTVLKMLENQGSREASQVRSEATLARAHIEVAQEIRTQTFVELPIIFPHTQTTAAIHVYENKASKNTDGSKTALIGLDTLGLGRFEVYISQTGRGLSCKFRLDDEIQRFVERRLGRLGQLLSESSLYLSSTDFLRKDEGFHGFTPPPDVGGDEHEIDKPLLDMKA